MTETTIPEGATRALATFLRSDALAVTKEEVQAVLAELRQNSPGLLSEADLRARCPTLLARVEVLPPGLDLFHILRGEPPLHRTHRRTHVAASLRAMRRQHGEALSVTDYPPGHVVPLLAAVYYGGIAAWSAGAGHRVQRQKGYWQVRANRLIALSDVAGRFPDRPLTHATLTRIGLAGLAKVVTAEQLDGLARELGIGRHLAQRSVGWWTPERCIDVYAALCRAWGATLSSWRLTELGGLACNVRARAAKLFASFAAFQAAAIAAHPNLQPPRHPRAADGTRLDSWNEVTVYDAIQAAMPGVILAVHVKLPERRSCDLLVGGAVWVEVLGLSLAAMTRPTSQYQRDYTEHWTAKVALYSRLGIDPVLIEPVDLVDAARLRAKLNEIAGRLGTACVPVVLAVQSRRANGTWTFDYLCQVVAAVADEVGGFPTHAALIVRGYAAAAQMLRRPGMAADVAAAIGATLPNRKGEWPIKRVIAAHVAWVQAHGAYPTGAELEAADQVALAGARARLFGGRQEALRAEVARRCGRDLPPLKALPGSYDTQEKVAALLSPLCRMLGRFPTGAEMRAALPATVYDVVCTNWGVRSMAAFMGVRYEGPRKWTRAAALAEFRARLPRLPDLLQPTGRLVVTCPAIFASMGHTGIALMQTRFGGITNLRAALHASRSAANNESDGEQGRAA